MTKTITAVERARQDAYDTGYEDGQQAFRQDAVSGDRVLTDHGIALLVQALESVSANVAKAIAILEAAAARRDEAGAEQ